MKLIYRKKSHIKVRFFCIFQKKAVPLQQFSVYPKTCGMWRSPVAQRSGGPEVASSNLVIPTK